MRKRPILLAAALLLAMLPQPRLALCVADSGHRALELLSADCCTSEAESHARAELEAPDHGCAPDCTDTPVGVGGALETSSPRTLAGTDLHAPPAPFGPTSNAVSGVLLALAAGGRDGPPGQLPRGSKTARSAVRRL